MKPKVVSVDSTLTMLSVFIHIVLPIVFLLVAVLSGSNTRSDKFQSTNTEFDPDKIQKDVEPTTTNDKLKVNKQKSALLPQTWHNAYRKGTTREQITCKAMEELHEGKPFKKARPDFLVNPETGKRLEIDCYNDELKIGAEYNGIQHYVFPNPFHTSKNAFDAQLRRDQTKADLCKVAGVKLYTVPHTIERSKIKQCLKDQMTA